MKLWKCVCDFQYVITDTHVYGPLILGVSENIDEFPVYWGMRIFTREEWDDMYADCSQHYSATALQAWRCVCGTLNEGKFGEIINDGKPHGYCRGCFRETAHWHAIYSLIETGRDFGKHPAPYRAAQITLRDSK